MRLLVCAGVGLVIVVVFASGCGDKESIGQEDSYSTHNGVDCDVSLTTLQDSRLSGTAILDPTAKRISDSERIRHLNELSLFSDAMLAVLRNHHVPIELTGGSVVEFAELRHLRGQVPRGWEGTGYTWDDVPGTGTERGVFLGDSGKPNNAWSLAVHEGTHAVDRTLGFSAKNDKLRSVYKAELARPAASSDPNAAYRRSNIEEFFAVAVDELHCNAATRARLHSLYPEMESFLTNDLESELAK